MIAGRTALVVAPSPLEGEGRNACQRVVMGEEASSSKVLCQETPSPISAVGQIHLALSLKGRGRSNNRPSCHRRNGAQP
jgi:hypothetical protein